MLNETHQNRGEFLSVTQESVSEEGSAQLRAGD